MKLKKIIASLTAAAMAVTTMAFAPLSVSAADKLVVFSGSTRIENWNTNANNSSLTADTTLTGSEFTDYENLTVTMSFDSSDVSDLNSNPWKAQQIAEVVVKTNDSYPPNAWEWLSTGLYMNFNAYSRTLSADEEITCSVSTADIISELEESFSQFDYKTMSNAIILKTGWVSGVTIKEIAFTDPKDNTVYTSKSYSPEINGTDSWFNGSWDLAKAVGPNARVEFKFNGELSNGFAICDASKGNFWENQLITVGGSSDKAYSVKLSALEAAGFTNTSQLVINSWTNTGNGNPTDVYCTEMVIYNGTDDEVYSETVLPESVTVTPSTAALVVGDTTALTAEVLPADATDPSITWASSDEKVATVDKNGKVTAVAEGKAAITATSNADDTVFGSCAVTVVSPEAEKYAVNVIKPENGTVTVKGGKTEAYADETIELVITPDADYALDTVTVNGKAISGTSFTMPAEDVTVEVIFKKLGSADAEIVAPEGVSVAFAGSEEDILKAVFGDDYAALVEAGYKLDVVMTVKDESAVSADDKALIEGELSDDMHIGLLVDVSLVKTQDGVSTAVASSSKPVSFVIGVPDSIIADGRTYSVIRVHNGKAENIGGTYDAANKTITVSSDKFSAYAVVYKDAPAPQPESKPAVTYYPITAGRNVTASASSAAAGTQINVRVDFGYDAYVLCGGKTITKITESGSFTMPAGKVTIVTEANGYLAMVKNAAPNSYIFVYDADMNYIRTNGSVKGIKGEGKITVKLGEEYAGKTVTLYKGRKSTSTELDSKTLDDNGNATFTVEGGKNYTAVVE